MTSGKDKLKFLYSNSILFIQTFSTSFIPFHTFSSKKIVANVFQGDMVEDSLQENLDVSPHQQSMPAILKETNAT